MDTQRWKKVKEIFYLTLEQSPDQRNFYLQNQAGDDEDLFRELQELMLAHESAGKDFLESPASNEALEIVHGKVEELKEGQFIGPYKILKQISHGGMGSVYLAARADDVYEKQVAIKLVRSGSQDPLLVQRFFNERQILANLEHQNIARLLDGGSLADGTPYLAMEYVEGEPVDEYCKTRKLSIDQRLHLFQSVCSAVQFAHQNLVVHRDIKPANVLVTADGVPKLLDFGIARILSSELSGSTVLPMMTLGYASPEQIRNEPITTATDIYSLGVLLYVLLTDHHPFQTVETTPEKIVLAVCESNPAKPSEAVSGEKRRRQLQGDLDNIVLMAMRKEISGRYTSAEQLSNDIRYYLEELPVRARGSTFQYRAVKFIIRNKWGVFAAALVFVSLVSGIAVSLWQARKAKLEALKAEQINAFVHSILASPDPWEKGKDVTVVEILSQASHRIDTELKDQPAVEASVRTTIGTTYLNLGEFNLAEPQLRKALAISRRIYKPADDELIKSIHTLGYFCQMKGELNESKKLYQEALLAAQQYQKKDLESAILFDMAELSISTGELDQAERLHRKNLEWQRARGLSNPDLPRAINGLAVVLGTKGDYAAAEKLHREALEVIRKQKGERHPDVAAAYNTLAGLLDSEKKYPEAKQLYLRALKLRKELLGPQHPDTAWTMYSIAYLLLINKDYAGAEHWSREVLALRGKTLPDTHIMISSSMQILGRSLMNSSNPAEAESLLRESLSLRKANLPPDHWLIAASESVLGECLVKIGKYSEAEKLLWQSYQKLKNKLGENHERTVEAYERFQKLQQKLNLGER